MRKLVLSSMIALVMASAGACKEPDPNAFETYIEKLRDPGTRGAGLMGLEQLTKAVVTAPDNKDRIEEFATKVIPVFDEIWADAPENRVPMLNMLRDVGHPAGASIWTKAIPLDGSSESRKETLLALEGIKKAKAGDAATAIIAELTKLVDDPKNDKGKEEGRLRLEMVETLGTLRATSAVPLMSKMLAKTKDEQPVAVHRGAAKALGLIGDPSAVDALLTVTYRVPDAPSTTDIFNRSFLALVAIGEPALPGIMKMFRGEHTEVNDLAAQHGQDVNSVKQTAAKILGGLGSKQPVSDLIAFMPKADCGEEGAETDPADAGLRAVVARSLGFIGDESAVDALCSCSMASHNPGDMWEIAGALGRIGGSKAVDCLVEVMKNGEYDPEAVDSSDFRYEIRWEAGRSAVLAASPDDLGKIKAAISAQTDAKVKEHMANWEAGIKIVEECKADKACYLKTVQDANADWFAREKAAVELAKLSKGDVETAVEISKAFKVRNPDARVTMAVLPVQMLEGKKCQACVDAFEGILKAEKGSMDPKNQLAVIKARHAIAKLRDLGPTTGGAAPAPAAPAPDAKAGADAKAGEAKAADAKAGDAKAGAEAKAEGKE